MQRRLRMRMRGHAGRAGRSSVSVLVSLGACVVVSVFAWRGASAQSGAIYSCTDAGGKRLTADHPIPECVAREQRVLNADGSVRRIVPAELTGDERAEREARDRKAAVARAAQQDAVRRDRTLLLRYPDEAAHAAARADALENVRKSMRLSEQRMAALAAERKPLLAETEFYKGRAMPTTLRQSLDANDAATEAQRTLIQNQQAELLRINALYDAQLNRLRMLWKGATPGTLGALNEASP